MRKSGFKQSTKSIVQNSKSNGFTLETAIAELIDNSIDAGAKKIKVKKLPQKNSPTDSKGNYYTFVISDDGKGMSCEKLQDVVSTMGYEETYEVDSISHFGEGLKKAALHLCDQGCITVVSNHSGVESKVIVKPQFDIPFDELIEYYEPKPSKANNGTEITITNVVDTVNNTSTIKFLAATYYPAKFRDKDFQILYYDHHGSETDIEFCDPMYRRKSEKYLRKIEFTEDDDNFKPIVNGDYVETTGYLFNTEEWTEKDFNYFDKRTKDSGFVNSRSGLYVRLGGRYISLGNGFLPSYQTQYYYNRLRIEVEIPKSCIDAFGIQVNKSEFKLNHENPLLSEWMKCIKYICGEAQKEKKISKISDKEEQNIIEDNKILNNWYKNKGKIKNPLENDEIKNTIPQETSFPDKPETENTKNRPSGLVYDKNVIEFRFVEYGELGPRYEGTRSGKKTIISINRAHPYYEKVIKKLDDFSRRVIFAEFYENYLSSTIAQVNYPETDKNIFLTFFGKIDENFRRIWGS
jgi:hypothetical protein